MGINVYGQKHGNCKYMQIKLFPSNIIHLYSIYIHTRVLMQICRRFQMRIAFSHNLCASTNWMETQTMISLVPCLPLLLENVFLNSLKRLPFQTSGIIPPPKICRSVCAKISKTWSTSTDLYDKKLQDVGQPSDIPIYNRGYSVG